MPGKLILPRRSRRFGVGKEIGGAVYLHRAYEYLIGPEVDLAKTYLPSDFDYSVVKYSLATRLLAFVGSPDFDTHPEPTVGDSWSVTVDGEARLRKQAVDPYIYHHKWLFVADDYAAFDVAESKA